MKYVRVRVPRLAKLLRHEIELLEADDENLVKLEGFTIHNTDTNEN